MMKQSMRTLTAALVALLMATPVVAQNLPDPGSVSIHTAGSALLKGCGSSGNETRIRIRLGGQRFNDTHYTVDINPRVQLSADSNLIEFFDVTDNTFKVSPMTVFLEGPDTYIRVRNKGGMNQGGKRLWDDMGGVWPM